MPLKFNPITGSLDLVNGSPDLNAYVQKTGDTITGTLNINTPNGSTKALVLQGTATGNLVFLSSAHYYKLDELSATSAADTIGSLNLTNNGTTAVTGLLNNGRSFNGTSDRLMGSGNMGVVVKGWAVSVWVKPNSFTGEQTIFYNGDDGAGYGIILNHTSSGSVDVLFGNVAWNYSGSTLPSVGAWYHIVSTRDTSGNLKMYINGVVTANTATNTPLQPASRSSIGFQYTSGGGGFQRYFNGTIDEVAYFNRGLTSADVATLYNSGSPFAYQMYTPQTTNLAEWRSSAGALNTYVDGGGNLYLPVSDIHIGANSLTSNGGFIGMGTGSPVQQLDVLGNFNVKDADTPSKQYRFRTNGSSLDFEGGGADLYLSVWSGANYTGTQNQQIQFSASGQPMVFNQGFYAGSSGSTIGRVANYWSNAYITRHYLNTTTYIDGAISGQATVSGSLSLPIATKTASYTLADGDYTVIFNSAIGITATLPSATLMTGRVYILKNIGAGAVSIATTSSQTVDGNLSPAALAQYGTLTVQSTGSNWIII